MKKLATLSSATLVLAAATSGTSAQVYVDMSQITCEQMLAAGPNAADVAVWLSGYYNGLRQNAKLDLNQFKRNAEGVVERCHANPKATLMKTIEEAVPGK